MGVNRCARCDIHQKRIVSNPYCLSNVHSNEADKVDDDYLEFYMSRATEEVST